jgi:BlaI family transcriptional regulator, penicillinase repressor
MPKKKPALPRPTDTELRLLNILWQHGPATVREVWTHLGSDVGYTTVLKLLQIMRDKGLVTRDENDASHVYAAALSESETQADLVGGFIDRVFGGSASRLVMHALGSKSVSADELKAIRDLLDQAEQDRK